MNRVSAIRGPTGVVLDATADPMPLRSSNADPSLFSCLSSPATCRYFKATWLLPLRNSSDLICHVPSFVSKLVRIAVTLFRDCPSVTDGYVVWSTET